MPIPTLDEVTKEALNALTLADLKAGADFAYAFHIGWDGTIAVAHVQLMRNALEIGTTQSLEEFLKDNNLLFEDQIYGSYTKDDIPGGQEALPRLALRLGRFITPLNILEKDGIFVPRHAYMNPGGEVENKAVVYFDLDLIQPILYYSDLSDERKGNMRELLDGNEGWQPKHFENRDAVNSGLHFAQELWRASVNGFNKYRHESPATVTELADRLIEYYGKIVMDPVPSN